MDIRSLLVSLEPGVASATLATAIDLARRFRARITGCAAAEPTPALLEGPAGIDRYYAVREEIEAALELAGSDFAARAPRDLLKAWVSGVEDPTRALRREAIGCDLVVVQRHADARDAGRQPDLADLILRSGRPVLVLPTDGRTVAASRIVVAWKDTREARRAVADALPFLAGADEVLVASVDEGEYGEERGSLERIVGWLAAHGVQARGEVLPMGSSLSSTIRNTAAAVNADLVVAGGYGHSRFREWFMGGMTQQLLDQQATTLLFSN